MNIRVARLIDVSERLGELRLKLRRLQKEANDLEGQIEELTTEQDRIVFEAEEQSRLRN